MATRTSVATGDWNVAGTWDTGVPVAGDNAIINGHVVTMTADPGVTLGTITLTSGTLNTAGYTVNASILSSSNSNVRTLNITNSTINISGTDANVWDIATPTNLTLTSTGSTINLTATSEVNHLYLGGKAYNNVNWTVSTGNTQLSSDNASVVNFTITNTAVKTASIICYSTDTTISGTFTVTGNSATNRILIYGSTLGSTSRQFTAAAVSLTNVDFRDIVGAGAATWSGTSIGDCGGNSNITFTTAATQTWSGTSGGNWSTNAWTTRVPLPQDDVVISSAFTASQTVTADMPRLGKSISWTGASGNPTWAGTINFAVFGGITLITGMSTNFTSIGYLQLYGRGNFNLTSAGKSFLNVELYAIGGNYTLQDAFTCTGSLTHANGGWSLNNNTATFTVFYTSYSNTRSVTGPGTIVVTSTGNVFNATVATGLTVSSSPALSITNTSASSKTLILGGYTFGNLSITGGGTGAVIIQGSNTFNNISVTGGASKTIQFTAGTTQTILGNLPSGVSGQLVTMQSTAGGSAWTISKASGLVICNFISLQDSAATGGATFYAGSNSTNVSGNTGWLWRSPASLITADLCLVALSLGLALSSIEGV